MKTININMGEGYLWWSDQQQPQVFVKEAVNVCLDETKNPFVVEGMLIDRETNMSYAIKYVDGQYFVQEQKVAEQDFDNPDNELKTFFANRMGDKWLTFLRFWEERPDENCMGMPVLMLTKNIFVGFKEKEDLI